MATISELEKSVQAILFAAGDPYEKERLTKLLGINRETLDQVVQRVNDLYQQTAFVILDLDQSYQMVTREEYAAVIREALEVKNNTPLSQAALEVLAIIAYNQPVTKSFVEQIRGVDSSSVVNSLVAKGLVQEMGRLEIPGRPISYGTTEHFLRCFGMQSIETLPKIPQPQEQPAAQEEEVSGEPKATQREGGRPDDGAVDTAGCAGGAAFAAVLPGDAAAVLVARGGQ